MKKILILLAVAVLLLGVSGQSMASLTTGDLIRVVYKNGGTGSEVATDMGAAGWTTPISGSTLYNTNNFSLGQFAGAGWGDLSVAYYANTTAGSFWFSGPDGGMDNSASKLALVRTALTQMNGVYSTAMGTTGKQGSILSSNASSYWNKMNLGGTNVGSWDGYVGTGMGVQSLADLGTLGYVDQYLYYYPSSSSNTAGTGMKLAQIRTFADGTTRLSEVPSAVPIPAAVYLFGTGLVGLIGIRRKKAA
jgi:hypothetical protein